MLVTDKTKMMYLAPNTSAPFAQTQTFREGLGCDCNGNGKGLSGLGLNLDTLIQNASNFDPEPISAAALRVMAQIQRFFGIGTGRMEADQIVPIQNQVVSEVIAPIADAVNADYRAYLSKNQLQQMLDALLNAKDAWLNMLHNTDWSDGRAATQAEATLEPYFTDQQRKIVALMSSAPTPDYTMPGGGSPVDIGGIPGLNLPPVTFQPGGGASIGALLQQYAPYLLLGAAVFALPKIGKYSHSKPNRKRRR